MPADLASLEINITGAGAVSQADAVKQAVVAMGEAGDTAAGKIESVGTAGESTAAKLKALSEVRVFDLGNQVDETGQAIRSVGSALTNTAERAQQVTAAMEAWRASQNLSGTSGLATEIIGQTNQIQRLGQAAAQAAPQVQSLFERLAQAGSVGGAAGLAQTVAQAQIAAEAFQKLSAFALEQAQSGDVNAASNARMADKATVTAKAIQDLTNSMMDLIAKGDSASNVLVKMTAGLSDIGAGANFSGKLQSEFAGLREEFAAVAEQETSLGDRAITARQAIENFGNAARTAGAQTVTSMNDAAAAETRVANEAKAAASSLGGATSFLTNLTMGASMLASGGGITQSLFGIQQLGKAMTEGAEGGAALGASLIALVPVLAAVAAAGIALKEVFDLVKEGMKGAAEDETFEIRMKNIMGTTKAATAEIERMKELSTTGSLSFVNTDDLKQADIILQQFTNGALNTEQGLKEVAGAAVEGHTSVSAMADQIGRLYAQMSIGAPIRIQMLQHLAQEGVLTENDVVAIKNMQMAHASASDIVDKFTDALKGSAAAADQSKNTAQGLTEALQNVVKQDIANPLGAALQGAAKPLIDDLTNFLVSQKGNIAVFAYDMEVGLLTAINLVKDVGIVGAMKDGLAVLGQYISDNWANVITEAGKTAFENWKHSVAGFLSWFDTQLRTLFDQAGKWLQGTATSLTHEQTTVTTDSAKTSAESQVNALILAGKGKGDPDFDAAVVKMQQAEAAATAAVQVEKDNASKNAQTVDSFKVAMDEFAKLPAKIGDAFAKNGFVAGFGTNTTAGPGVPFTGDVTGRTFQGKATAFGFTGDTSWDSQSGAGHGAYDPNMVPGSAIGMSQLTGQALGMQHMQQAVETFTDSLGNVTKKLVYWADTADDAKKGTTSPFMSLDQFRPDLSPSAGNNFGPKVSITPLGTFESPHSTSQLGQSGQSDIDRAKAEALQQAGKPQVPDTPSKTGIDTINELDTKTKDLHEAQKAMNDLIKEATVDYTTYGTRVKTIQEQIKDGQISVTDGKTKEIALTNQEISVMGTQITTLQKMEVAAKAANDTSLQEKAHAEILKLQADMEKLNVDLGKLGGSNVWDSFKEGITQATNAWGDLSTKVQTAGKDMTNALASGLTSGLVELVSGTKSASQAFKDMALSILQSIEQIIVKLLVEQAIEQASVVLKSFSAGLSSGGIASTSVGGEPGSPFAAGGPVGFAVGGPTAGPSGPVSGGIPGQDSVSALLTPGEFVLTTNEYAEMAKLFSDMHQSGMSNGPAAFSAGGEVGAEMATPGFSEGGPVLYNQYASGGQVDSSKSSESGAERAASEGHSFNTTVNVMGGDSSGGSMSPRDARQFQEAVTASIRFEISKQRKPGGLLNRSTGGG